MYLYPFSLAWVFEPWIHALVRDYQEVFIDDIITLSPKREVEFTIDVIPGEGSVSKAPYRMSVI
jgi:hypothetical protein